MTMRNARRPSFVAMTVMGSMTTLDAARAADAIALTDGMRETSAPILGGAARIIASPGHCCMIASTRRIQTHRGLRVSCSIASLRRRRIRIRHDDTANGIE
jgi:hypothetical protein